MTVSWRNPVLLDAVERHSLFHPGLTRMNLASADCRSPHHACVHRRRRPSGWSGSFELFRHFRRGRVLWPYWRLWRSCDRGAGGADPPSRHLDVFSVGYLRFPPVMEAAPRWKNRAISKAFPIWWAASPAWKAARSRLWFRPARMTMAAVATGDLRPCRPGAGAEAACYPVYPIAADARVSRCRMRAMSSTWRAIVSATSPPKAWTMLPDTSACGNMCASGTPEQIQAFREPWIARAQGIADAIGPARFL